MLVLSIKHYRRVQLYIYALILHRSASICNHQPIFQINMILDNNHIHVVIYNNNHPFNTEQPIVALISRQTSFINSPIIILTTLVKQNK